MILIEVLAIVLLVVAFGFGVLCGQRIRSDHDRRLADLVAADRAALDAQLGAFVQALDDLDQVAEVKL